MAKKSSKQPRPSLGPNLAQAMDDAEVAPRDERGLVPLADARARVQAATAFTRDELDPLWAALLSLEDGAELVREALRLDWRYHPRGRENEAPVERYGDAVLPWIAARVDERGVLVNFPWCLGPSLLAIGTPAAFDLVWGLRGYDDTSEMSGWELEPAREVGAGELAEAADGLREAWIRAHEAVALGRLADLAEAGDARAAGVLQRRARAAPQRFAGQLAGAVGAARASALATTLALATALTEEAILERLDAECAAGRWPLFYYQADGRLEYFAMRLVAARAAKGDGWGIVFQRLCGSYPDGLRIDQVAYGSEVGDPFVDGVECPQVEWEDDAFHGGTVTGPAGELTFDEGTLDEQDLRFGTVVEVGYHPYRTFVIRAVLAAQPDAFWPDDRAALAVLGLGKGAKVLLASAAFHHVIGGNGRVGTPDRPWEILPSASPTFRSLAAAIVARDAARFEPGDSNLDWRLHAFTEEPVPPPWTTPRFDPPWLGAAMREAAVAPDARGLMPLDDARAALAGVARFERGAGRRVGEHYVQGSDRLWAALLSLADGDELAARGRLDWALPVRGAADNVAVAERYGAGAVPWIRGFADGGVLHDRPGCLRACLLALGGDEALGLLLELDGVAAAGAAGTPSVQRALLLEAWLDIGPARLAPLVRLAAAGHPGARALLRARALVDDGVAAAVTALTGSAALLDEIGVPRALSPEHVLARLDRAAAGPAEDQERWPRFFHGLYPGQAEYHGLRLLAVRAADGDGWAVALERLTGYNPTKVWRYVYRPGAGGHDEAADRALALELGDGEITGPAGTVSVDDVEARARCTEPPDYWAQREAHSAIAPVRAYVDAHADACFTDAATLAAALGVPSPVIVADTRAFAHADGPEAPPETERRPAQVRPSESPAYRAVAAAIAARDPAAFDPGTPNTDWRAHAVFGPDGG